MIEIGEVKNNETNPVYFDDNNNLKNIIEKNILFLLTYQKEQKI